LPVYRYSVFRCSNWVLDDCLPLPVYSAYAILKTVGNLLPLLTMKKEHLGVEHVLTCW
jgi:hypothetical protein